MIKLKSLDSFKGLEVKSLCNLVGGKDTATSSSIHTITKTCSDTKVVSDHETKTGTVIDSVCTSFDCP
jgi:hypothetical protein